MQNTHDSGYNSQSLDAARLRSTSLSEGEEYDEEEIETNGENDDGRELGTENEREGEGLLWENGQQNTTPFSTSPVDTFTRVIPPTPASQRPESTSLDRPGPAVSHHASNESLVVHDVATTDEEEEEEQDYITTREQEAMSKESRRISFNASVRISGGIRTKPSRRAMLESDLFSPVASTSTHHSRPRSRRASPQRTLSQSSHPRDASSSSLGAEGQAHSTTTSAFPSRSSSPCSSIYAPLQPSSQTCPSSAIFIRAPGSVDNTKNRSEVESKGFWNATLGPWRDYLLGTKRNRLIGKEDAAKAAKGYRDLVEEQRQLRQVGPKRNHQRRRSRGASDPPDPIMEEKEGLLPKVWGLLKSGVVARGRGGGFGIATSYGTNLGSGATKSGSRNGGMAQVAEEGGSRAGQHRQQQRTRRSSSTLSISDLVSFNEEGTGFSSLQNSAVPAPTTITQPPTSSYLPVFANPFENWTRNADQPKPKSTADVIYGPAPGRWITARWIRDVVASRVTDLKARVGRCWNGEEEI